MRIKKSKWGRRGGFTLVEAAVGILLTGMLFSGAITLYITACRTAAGANAQGNSAAVSANAVSRITDDTREAYYIDLPSDTASASGSSFVPFGAYALSDFRTTSGGTTYDTCIQLTYPASTAVSLLNSAGTAVAASPTPYDRSGVNSSRFYIYRSNSTGVPKPADGQYLWAYGNERGAGSSINRQVARLSDGYTAALANAVQFTRPLDSSGAILTSQVEIRLISSALSPVTGQQTSEGATALLTGKCTLMRNHE